MTVHWPSAAFHRPSTAFHGLPLPSAAFHQVALFEELFGQRIPTVNHFALVGADVGTDAAAEAERRWRMIIHEAQQ